MKREIKIIRKMLLPLLSACDIWAGSLIVVGEPQPALLGLGTHIVLVVLYTLVLKRIRIQDKAVGSNLLWLAAVMSAAVPAYGMSAMTLVLLAVFLNRKKMSTAADISDEYDTQTVPSEITKTIQTVFEFKRGELQIDAFRDILRQGNKSLEERSIQKLAEIGDRQSVRVLQEIVRNSSSDSKILAASALIDIESKITKRIQSLKEHLDFHRSDQEAILTLARTYDIYCYLGVLSPAITAHYQALAMAQYEKYLHIRPNHPEATFEFGRLLLKSGKFQAARTMLEKAIDLQPENPGAFLWLAEVYYKTGRFAKVVQICRQAAALEFLPERIRRVTEWWTDGEEKIAA